MQRESSVFGGQVIARCEFDAVANLEGKGQAVFGDVPAFGDDTINFRDVVIIKANQAVICVASIFQGGKFEHPGRIECDKVVDGKRHDEGIFRGFGLCRHWCGSQCGSQNQPCDQFAHFAPPVLLLVGSTGHSVWGDL